MAKGITQDQVSHAADQLLNAGERPTIERIRALLGTGSPNTVNRYLDDWWGKLGKRLQNQKSNDAMPGLPLEVANLATDLWGLAVQTAEGLFSDNKSKLNEEHAAAMANLAAIERDILSEINTVKIAFEASQASKLAVEQKLENISQLFDNNTEYLQEVKKDRDMHRTKLEEALSVLEQERIDTISKLQAFEIHRKEIEASHQATQTRWILEVDRARQDEAGLATKLKQVEKLYEREMQHLKSVNADLNDRNKLIESESKANISRISALESELKRLHDQLSIVLNKSQAVTEPSRRRVKNSKDSKNRNVEGGKTK